MKHLCAAFLLLVFASFAVQAQDEPVLSVADNFNLEPRTGHEVCYDMTAGQQLSYQFRGDRYMRFNVHYHVGEDAINIDEADSKERAETLTVPKTTEICLMWGNLSRRHASDVSFSLDVRNGQALKPENVQTHRQPDHQLPAGTDDGSSGAEAQTE